MFLSHVDREKNSFANEILALVKDDDPIVMEAVGKLVYEIALFNPTTVYLYLCNKKISKTNTKLIIDLLLKSTRFDDSYKNRLQFILDNYEN